MGIGELFLPRSCAGCHAPGSILCGRCRTALKTVPFRHFPPVAIHAPVYALAPYGKVHREIIVEMKERANMAVRPLMGAVLAAAIENLAARGEVVLPALLVPAPTRARSARLRGGDPVENMCRGSGLTTVSAVSLQARTPDQAGLSAARRRRNIAYAIKVDEKAVAAMRDGGHRVIVVDDVVTTGATMAATVAHLQARGLKVAAVVAICAA